MDWEVGELRLATKAPYLALLCPLEVHKYRREGKGGKIVGSLAEPHHHKGKERALEIRASQHKKESKASVILAT